MHQEKPFITVYINSTDSSEYRQNDYGHLNTHCIYCSYNVQKNSSVKKIRSQRHRVQTDKKNILIKFTLRFR